MTKQIAKKKRENTTDKSTRKIRKATEQREMKEAKDEREKGWEEEGKM